jgi:predicted  nucleic acid-binding Zn-ribbon protein
MLTAPRPNFLATGEERNALARIAALERQLLETDGARRTLLTQRLNRLKGVLTWTLETEYHERLTSFDKNLRDLHQAVALLQEQYHQFVRVRQAATHSYEGYAKPISGLRTRVRQASAKVDLLMARQGHVLEVVAVDELQVRRQRLENYQNQARYALADSYDRATQAQARRAVGE